RSQKRCVQRNFSRRTRVERTGNLPRQPPNLESRMTSARLDPASPMRQASWGPTVIGALLGLALAGALSLAGAGLGFSLVDPWSSNAPMLRGFDMGALTWLLFINIDGLAIGGTVAYRLH